MGTVPELDLQKYVAAIVKWKWLLIIATLVAALLSYVVSASMPKIYQSMLTLQVGDDTVNTHPSLDDVTVSQRLASVYASMITREPVMSGTVDALHLPMTWYELARHILVTRLDGSQIIDMRVIDTDPRRTKAIADEIAHQLILQSPTAENAETLDQQRQFVRQQLENLQTNIMQAEVTLSEKQAKVKDETSARGVMDLQDQIRALELNLTNWRTSYATLLSSNLSKSPNTLTVIQPSFVPGDPISPNVRMNVLTGALLGLILTLAAVFLIEFLKGQRLTEPQDVTRALDLPVLGKVGKMPPAPQPREYLVTALAPQSSFAEDYRRLRVNVQFAWDSDEAIQLLVTSSGPQEGKSVTSANLAVAFARAGKRTILIDADLMHPSLHDFFGLPNEGGLTTMLWGQAVATGLSHEASHASPAPGENLIQIMHHRLESLLVHTDVPGLRFLPAGPSFEQDSTDFLPTEDMESMLEALRGSADVVILDGPPVLAVSETAALAAMGLGVLPVIEAGITRTDAARMMHEELVRARARVLGVVLNQSKTTQIPYYQKRRRQARRSRGQHRLRVLQG